MFPLNKIKIAEIVIALLIAFGVCFGIYSLVKTTLQNKKVLTEVVTFLNQQVQQSQQMQAQAQNSVSN